MPAQSKYDMLEKVKGSIEASKGVFVVDYRGLTGEQDTQLRKQMRAAGIIYKVYKNTMMKRAFEGTELAELDPFLEGPSAIAISNDGAQIAQEDIPHVFDRFYRADRARTPGGGHGLGLAIAKQVAVNHGGDIVCRSSAGNTVFTVKLPLMKQD